MVSFAVEIPSRKPQPLHRSRSQSAPAIVRVYTSLRHNTNMADGQIAKILYNKPPETSIFILPHPTTQSIQAYHPIYPRGSGIREFKTDKAGNPIIMATAARAERGNSKKAKIRGSREIWPSRNGLCIATRERKENEENGVQRGLWIGRTVASSKGQPLNDRAVRAQPAPSSIYRPCHR